MRRGTDKFKPEVSIGPAGFRECDHPHCNLAAEHRAPKSRDRLDQYHWFCLEHVREYNKAWNFCSGMDSDEIETEIRQDTVWRRPTWPMGSGPNERRWRFMREEGWPTDLARFRAKPVRIPSQKGCGGQERIHQKTELSEFWDLTLRHP